MKLSAGILVLFVCLPFLDAVEFRSDYQFSQDVHGWLKFHKIPATWQDAQLMCHLEGTVLASPTNAQLLKAMTELINVNTSPPRSVFTGVSATYSKGVYFSIEGVPLSELPVTWAQYEPDNLDNDEECLILLPDSTIADVKCQNTFSYICYRNKTEDMPPMTECGTIDTAYQLESRTGSCYKFHHVARTWSEAFKTCAAEGGHLAIANSPTEAQVFQELFKKSPKAIGVSTSPKIVILGFRYSELQKSWLTIHGQTLEQAGYANWAGHEPNNAKNAENHNEGEYCGSIDMGCSKIGFNDYWCKHNNTFICEKDPKSLAKEIQDVKPPLLSILMEAHGNLDKNPDALNAKEEHITENLRDVDKNTSTEKNLNNIMFVTQGESLTNGKTTTIKPTSHQYEDIWAHWE